MFHGKGIKLYLLFDIDQSVTGSRKGTQDANSASTEARNLGVPHNGTVAIYRDVEPGTTIDYLYINAWYNQLLADGYIPAFYNGTDSGNTNFENAFCAANASTISGSYLWECYPQIVTYNPVYPADYKSSSLPNCWNPTNPYCVIGNTTAAWQYQAQQNSSSPVDVDSAATIGTW